MPYAIRYHFSQHLCLSAQVAYAWCTDYTPKDHALMGIGNGKRKVEWLTDSTVVLKESLQTTEGAVEKQKLVHLYPDRLMWVSTHITGSNKHSQFIYEIKAEDGASCLDFTALHIEHRENLSHNEVEKFAEGLRVFDSNIWKRLAKTMEKEVSK